MRILLERGAEPTADALRAGAASEGAPVDGIVALLERGVRDEQSLDLASRHGDTAVAAALRKAGFKESSAPTSLERVAMPRTARDAIAVTLPLLQHVDTVFLQ